MPDSRGNINATLTVDQTAMTAAMRQFLGELKRAGVDLDKIESKSGKHAKRTQQRFKTVGLDIARSAAQFAGLGSAIGGVATFAAALRRELEASKEVQRRAGEQQVSVARASRRAGLALPNDSPVSLSNLRSQLNKGSRGVNLSELLLTAEGALSASGANVPVQDVVDTILNSVQVAPTLDLSARKALVESAIEVQKGFGSTPEESIAGILNTLKLARTTDVETFSKNLIASIVPARAFGGDKDSFEFLSSVFIGIGQRAGDPTGRRTGSSGTNVMVQAFTEAVTRGIIPSGSSFEELIDKLFDGSKESESLRKMLAGVFDKQITKEELAALARNPQDPGIRREARTSAAVIELVSDLNRNTQVWDLIRTALDNNVGLTQEAVDLLARSESDRRSERGQAAEETLRGIKGPQQRIRQSNAAAGITGATNKEFRDLLLDVGVPFQRAMAFGATESIGVRQGMSAERLLSIRRGALVDVKARQESRLSQSIETFSSLMLPGGYFSKLIFGTAPATEARSEALQEAIDNLTEQLRSLTPEETDRNNVGERTPNKTKTAMRFSRTQL